VLRRRSPAGPRRAAYAISAPAKVNLTLHVLARRADGFHELSSLFAPISLADRLRVEVGGGRSRLRVPGFPALETADNLVLRAARAFGERTGLAAGVDVLLEKKVPLAAGLGGGSSDAGAVLRVLCRHHRLAPSDARVQEAALSVGSDVPFFLAPQPSLVSGRGEVIVPAPPLPPTWLVLLKPPFGVTAREAYAELSRGRAAGVYPAGRDPGVPRRLGAARLAALLHNDLEAPVSALFPVQDAIARLRAAGGRRAVMSGSGSCVFAVFDSSTGARKCARSLELRRGEAVFVARTLKRGAGVRETDPHAARRVDDGTGGSSRG
jgi:4-diphosphocytidyl-2-C-methyl-D-erythritol kinase